VSHSFRTREVAELFASMAQWSHPEYPFLDKRYSPGSDAPATDLSLAVADWLQNGRIDAVKELWFYIAPNGIASERILMSAIRARTPQQLRIPVRVEAELRAIYLLTLRARFVHFTFDAEIGAQLAASTLACYPAKLARPDEIGVAPSDAVLMLREVAPMVRLVVYRYFADSWHVGRLNLNLGYDERMYGCGREPNQVAIEQLGFFGPPTDDVYVPAVVTKEILKTELESAGFKFKKTDTRKQMIEVARNIPGLVSGLVSKYCPDLRKIRQDWRKQVDGWVTEMFASQAQAREILVAMGLQGLRRGQLS